ncbi:Transmembrane and coiled-coil domains protein 1 [Operophtera brumata]|uniref:Transmembrane and coiled-coil domains protein 1 n=1 Tax=Operophtera brumata TaxID=104452 RepID=A0A0L7LDT6_OPEBR|nr:Transmembrane and coiled-coil domains protein 1 [Operophtera brumata]
MSYVLTVLRAKKEPSSSASSRHGGGGGGERPHHVKSHSRDLGNSPLSGNTTANSSRDLEDSPQKKIISSLIAPGDYSSSVYSPNVSYGLSSDEYGSPAYRSQDGDYSNQDNVNEYLKLAANADKQQLQRIKAVFEKKNQKSALCIAQLQKKLEGYNKRIKSWERDGGAARVRAPLLALQPVRLRRQHRAVERSVSVSVSECSRQHPRRHHGAGRQRDGGAARVREPLLALPPVRLRRQHRAFCYNVAANASSEGSRASEAGEAAPRGSTLPRAATSPAPKYSPDASPSSSVTSEGAPYPTQAGSNNISETAFTIKPILNELRERREDYERLSEKFDALKNLSQEVSFLSAALQEERFKTERLEEQINDLTELHQNEASLCHSYGLGKGVRVITTSVAVLVGVVVLKQWPEVAQLSEHLVRRLKEYLLDTRRDR